MSRETTNHSFDDLARDLASGTISRGKALRLMAAALLGGALSFTPKVAEALPQAIHNPHKCNSKGGCKEGSCCGGTCCGLGEEGTPPAQFVSCFLQRQCAEEGLEQGATIRSKRPDSLPALQIAEAGSPAQQARSAQRHGMC